MGQYYKPVSLPSKQWLYSHDYGNGLKLMEHSYIGNVFVNTVEGLLGPGGAWHKTRIVWAGDYADEEKNRKSNLHNLCGDDKKIMPWPAFARYNLPAVRYVVNHSKKVYADLQTIPKDEEGYQIHPLPILTADGNGRGGGDYWDENDARVGSWARDIISMENEPPLGFVPIDCVFSDRPRAAKLKGNIPNGQLRPDMLIG